MPDEPTSAAGDGGLSSPPAETGDRTHDAGIRTAATSVAPETTPTGGPVSLPDAVDPSPAEPGVTSSDPRPGPGPRPGPRRPSDTTTSTPATTVDGPRAGRPESGAPRRPGTRARKVGRIVRHIDPWSVLKISVLFYAALFLIICVASMLLWGAARSAGTVEDVESFVTSVGGFGNCEPIDGAAPTTTTTVPGAAPSEPVDQISPAATDTTLPAEAGVAVDDPPGEDEDCREGEQLVGEFEFEDGKIFQAFVLGGIVLVLAGSAANVVMALLFNLMSDLTGGVQVTVLEEEPAGRPKAPPGSPRPRPSE